MNCRPSARANRHEYGNRRHDRQGGEKEPSLIVRWDRLLFGKRLQQADSRCHKGIADFAGESLPPRDPYAILAGRENEAKSALDLREDAPFLSRAYSDSWANDSQGCWPRIREGEPETP